jgi:hypothetical protein
MDIWRMAFRGHGRFALLSVRPFVSGLGPSACVHPACYYGLC